MKGEPFPVLTGDARTDRALVNLAQLLLEIAGNQEGTPVQTRDEPTAGVARPGTASQRTARREGQPTKNT